MINLLAFVLAALAITLKVRNDYVLRDLKRQITEHALRLTNAPDENSTNNTNKEKVPELKVLNHDDIEV